MRRVRNRFRNIAKEPAHASSAAQMALCIFRQQPARMLKIDAVPNRREDIEDLPFVAARVTYPVSRHHGQVQRCSDAKCSLITAFLAAFAMSLQLDIHICSSKYVHQRLHRRTGLGLPSACQCRSQRPLLSAGHDNHSRGKFAQIIQGRGTLCLACFAHLVSRNHLAEISIAHLVCAQHRKTRSFRTKLVRLPCGRQ